MKRAAIINQLHVFFAERNVLEVQTPLLGKAPVTDPYLVALTTQVNSQAAYLQTSPEYAMKRLLSAGSGDIYQICKAFRQDEVGRLHKPEFTMLEWYRIDFDDHMLMQEISDLCQEVFGCEPADKISYQEVFEQHLGGGSLTDLVKQHCGNVQGLYELDNTTALQLLFSQVIEPKLGLDRPVLIYNYPKDQAALARLQTDKHGQQVAARFELYYQGIELANGYWELTDAAEQLKRFEVDLAKRHELGLPQVPIDEELMQALEAGLPDCAGVALGLDRLVMLALGETSV